MREWNAAETYHRVSNPQFEWGLAVLERLPLEGDELVLDVGCGTGRLTERLIRRLPRGQVIAVDLSSNMLRVARDQLRSHPRHVRFARADATALPLSQRADAIFSTATFHWVLDHPKLFTSLHDALKPGGCLVAQCGGGANLETLHARTAALMREPRFAPHFGAWRDPWEFANASTTAARLAAAGFVDVRASVEPAPATFPDASAFSEFLTNVICRPHLPYLPEAPLRDAFVAALTEHAALDAPAFTLDYWRLNFDARKPEE